MEEDEERLLHSRSPKQQSPPSPLLIGVYSRLFAVLWSAPVAPNPAAHACQRSAAPAPQDRGDIRPRPHLYTGPDAALAECMGCLSAGTPHKGSSHKSSRANHVPECSILRLRS